MKYPDISLDIETLCTKTNAAIASIGAVRFNLITGEIDNYNLFDVQIDLNSKNLGVINGPTVKWWLSQSKDAIDNTFMSDTQDLFQTLSYLDRWCNHTPNERPTLWTNGPLFDERIINEACARFDLAPPTNFRDSRCVRTITDVAKRLGWVLSEDIVNPMAHGALSDAIFQAKMMIDAFKFLNSPFCHEQEAPLGR